MNPNKPYPGNSSDNENDLQQVEQRYRALDQDQPPAMVDEAILNKARLAVESHAMRPWNFGWMHASATAALLVLGLTLVQQHRSDVPATPLGQDRSVPLTTKATETSVESRLNEEIDMIGTSRIDTLERNEIQDADHRGFDDRARDETSADLADENEAKMPEPLQRESMLKRQPIGLPEQESARAVNISGADAEIVERKKDEQKLNQPASESGLPAPAGAFALQEPEEDFAAARKPSGPDAWLARILELKRQAADDAWRRELQDFVVAYPDYPLPAELGNKPGNEPDEGPDNDPGGD